ncbi:MAG: hypothetical protein LBT29_03020 [Flavobacteriaceae bacterium]|jgi:hypothetical protein|nr:hypothetical protein [Flavobacteriaceae bacterium]
MNDKRTGNERKRIADLKKCILTLEEIVPTIDKIGSGFDDTENTALALLLYFKDRKVLDKLANVRKIISLELQSVLTKNEFDEFIEQDINYWKPPYGENKSELLKILNG